MGLETANTIAELNPAWPLGTDSRSQGDDHLRMLKRVLQNSTIAATSPWVLKSGDTMTGALAVTTGGQTVSIGVMTGGIRSSNTLSIYTQGRSTSFAYFAQLQALTLKPPVADATAHSLYCLSNDGARLDFGVRGDGSVLSAAIYNNTSTGSPNLVQAANFGIYRSTSLRRYKTGIQDIVGASEAVLALRPVTFRSVLEVDEGRAFAGFISEEVAEAYPLAAEFESYDMRGILAVTVAALREALGRIAALEAGR